jgi:integrase
MVEMTQIQSQTEEKKRFKLFNAIAKLRSSGLSQASDFLETKALKSKATAMVYASGIKYLDRFVKQYYPGNSADTIISLIRNGQVDVYTLVNRFVAYLREDTKNGSDLTPRSIESYVGAVRSYFLFKDVDISIAKWKNRVTLPTIYSEDEDAIDAQDVRNILQHCNNRRLKSYLLVLASSGARAMEAITLRESDIDLSAAMKDDTEPGLIRIRKEYTKTRRERRIFISNEAAKYLQSWIDYIYEDRNNKSKSARKRNADDLIFSSRAWNWKGNKYPTGLYDSLLQEFQKLLKEVGLIERKEDGVYKRRKITFHSFRRFVKTTIANQTRNSDYSEWFLGHSKSPYWVNKSDKLKAIYKEDCMKYLTFLSYDTVENVARNTEDQLKALRKENELLRAQMRHVEVSKQSELTETTNAIADLTNTVKQLQKEVIDLKSKNKEK